MKTAILVVGMHRSGTSALCGTLNLLGQQVGEKLIPTNYGNPKGFFENEDILVLNNRLLTILGTSWDDTEISFIADVDTDLVKMVEDTIKDVFGQYDHIVIKDPRLCLLLPFYSAALENLGYDVFCIRSYRSPDQIICSLMVRDGFTDEKCVELLRRYDSCAKKYLPKTFLTVSFNDLIFNTDEAIKSITNFIPHIKADDESIGKIKGFLDPSLKTF